MLLWPFRQAWCSEVYPFMSWQLMLGLRRKLKKDEFVSVNNRFILNRCY